MARKTISYEKKIEKILEIKLPVSGFDDSLQSVNDWLHCERLCGGISSYEEFVRLREMAECIARSMIS